ncbi:hypothetical protein GGR54DRAFT_607310 [Hypoxylon sp. NC1633]|nr:hypothetical protein GGR54DRAFT_607310 [Hypoxylon sp. NC1633]
MSSSNTKEKRPTKMPKSKVIRPLGDMERFEAALHSLDFYRSSMVACRYLIPAGQDSLQEELVRKVESAIAKVVLDHPALRVGMRGEHARKPAFVELETVDFRKHVEWRSISKAADYEGELLQTISSRLNVKVEQSEAAPAWRILVLRVESEAFLDVMFEWGHAHMDGMSAKLFHEDLLRNLASDSVAGPDEFKDRVLFLPPEKRRDMLPPLHALCKFPITMGYTLSTLWHEFKPQCLAATPDTLAYWAPIRTKPYLSRYRHFSLDDARLKNVLAACRSHGTTLTGLIEVLALVSLAARLPPTQARGFTGSTALNLRPLLASGSKYLRAQNIDATQTMGNFVSIVDHIFDAELVAEIRAYVSRTRTRTQGSGEEGQGEGGEEKEKEKEASMAALEELVWPTAQRVRAELQTRLDKGTTNDEVGLMKFIPDFRALVKDWARKPRLRSFVLTNLGVIDRVPSPSLGSSSAATAGEEKEGRARAVRKDGDGDGYGWSIERAIFSLSHELQNGAICLCPMAVKDGDLYVTSNWTDGVVDTALAEGLMADLERWLRFLGRRT